MTGTCTTRSWSCSCRGPAHRGGRAASPSSGAGAIRSITTPCSTTATTAPPSPPARDVACALGRLDDPDAAVGRAPRRPATEVTASLDGPRPERCAHAAEAAGLSECWAIPVDDPLHGSRRRDRGVGPRRRARSWRCTATPSRRWPGMLALILQWRLQVDRACAGPPGAIRSPASPTGPASGRCSRRSAPSRPEPRVGVLYVDLDGFKGGERRPRPPRRRPRCSPQVGQRMAARPAPR